MNSSGRDDGPDGRLLSCDSVLGLGIDKDCRSEKLNQRTAGSLMQKGLAVYPGLAKIYWAIRLASINEPEVYDSKASC
jgi:hypothetical protein